ncbi:MAG TPA: hypothetical protein VHV82_17090 [Sporichthyaceae bacterium]|jgi:hypothetical protein|nr:hypothetical protein [Sporichthyaceae bacterium]
MDGQIVETDKRGRASLGRPGQRYLMHEQADGTLVLEPAVVITDMERRFLANAQLQAEIEQARAHPEERVARKRR